MPAKIEIGFSQMEDQLRRLEQAGAQIRPIVTESLEETQLMINRDLRQAMQRHHRDHKGKHTVDAIIESKVEWDGDTAAIDLGFDIANGGLASIFLMYGTKPHGPRGTSEATIRRGGGHGHPGTQPDTHLKNAIFGTTTAKKIKDLQAEALAKASQEILGG